MRSVKPYFSPALPHILAHRGLHEGVPDNSLEAFELALAAGATHLETDARATRDGIAVLVHDPVIVVDNATTVVRQSTWEQLSALSQRHNLRITSLSDALVAFPEARFNIDIKSDDAVEPVAAMIGRHSAHARVLLASFSARRRQRTASRLPGVAQSASQIELVLLLLVTAIGLRWVARRVLTRVDALQIPRSSSGIRVLTKRLVRYAHASGVFIHVWTVNDPREMRELVSGFGIDGIVTDRTDLAQVAFGHPNAE